MQGRFDLELEERRFTATLAHDVSAMRACLHDDFSFLHSSGRLDTKATYLDLLENGTLRYVEMTWRDMRLLADIGDVAQVFSRLDFSATYGGKDLSVSTYIISSWVRSDDGWRALSTQSTPILDDQK